MVVPFHCSICFDEFNLSDRTPMVLPCGHTYVCALCTKRLTRCMECRESIFWNPPVAPSTSLHVPHLQMQTRALPGRYNRPVHASPPTLRSPPRKPLLNAEPTPLPVPRNLVMIAMMEAARSRMVSDIDNQEANDNDENENEGEEEIEAQARRMLSGMEALSGPCGTYAVKEDDGLAVLPFDPRKRNTPSDASLKNAKDPFNLVKRQNIQVVEVGDGVYKLARDGGYVVASDSQLVKGEFF